MVWCSNKKLVNLIFISLEIKRFILINSNNIISTIEFEGLFKDRFFTKELGWRKWDEPLNFSEFFCNIKHILPDLWILFSAYVGKL